MVPCSARRAARAGSFCVFSVSGSGFLIADITVTELRRATATFPLPARGRPAARDAIFNVSRDIPLYPLGHAAVTMGIVGVPPAEMQAEISHVRDDTAGADALAPSIRRDPWHSCAPRTPTSSCGPCATRSPF